MKIYTLIPIVMMALGLGVFPSTIQADIKANTERLNRYLDQLPQERQEFERREQVRLEQERLEREKAERLEREPDARHEAKLIGIDVSALNPSHTRIIFNLTSNIDHDVFSIKKPFRLVIDLKNTHKTTSLWSDKNETLLLRNIRSAVRKKNDLRFVLDMKSKVHYHAFWVKPKNSSGQRLVVDLLRDLSTPMEFLKNDKKLFATIAIDTDNGGMGDFAQSQSGTREKDVTLALAKKLKIIINSKSGYKAFLTSESNKFLGVRERVAIARKHQAHLLISLHVDAFTNSFVKGASVYALSLNGANSEVARLIAEKENSSDLIGGVSLDDKDDLIASVLLDLSLTATIQDSLELGANILRHLGKFLKLKERQVQQANLEILKAPDMPSVYVNIDNLSNPDDELNHRTSGQLQNIATSIFTAIQEHLIFSAIKWHLRDQIR